MQFSTQNHRLLFDETIYSKFIWQKQDKCKHNIFLFEMNISHRLNMYSQANGHNCENNIEINDILLSLLFQFSRTTAYTIVIYQILTN